MSKWGMTASTVYTHNALPTDANPRFAHYFNYQRHGPTVPALAAAGAHDADARRDPKQHAIAIIGGGPVGLSLALGLARYGVASVVLEADDSVCSGSRAACISRRSLEIFEQLGVARAIKSKGLAWTSGTSYYRDTPVYRLEMSMDENQKHPPMVNLEQCYVEQYLVDAISNNPLIELRWQSKVIALRSSSESVALDVTVADSVYTLNADRVVACDGARSIARQALGLRLEGTQYEGTYIIVDLLLRSNSPTERRAWFDPPSNPGSTILMHRQPDDIWRIDYQLRDDERIEDAIKPENVLPRVRSHLRWIGERDDWQPVWISSYKANCLTLDRYDHGRVLFAGDAAHLVPIFGVRGLNSGIDDAHNLAWKLAYVTRGLATESLLASYSNERVHAARENIRAASKSTEFMAPPDFAFELMRKATLSLAVKHRRFATLVNPRQTSAIAYPDSSLSHGSHGAFERGPEPGEVLPECPLGTGYITDLLGPHYTIFYFGDTIPVAINKLEATASSVVVRLIQPNDDPHGRCATLYGASAGSAYLVRPDGHVIARWKNATVDDAGVMSTIAAAMNFGTQS